MWELDYKESWVLKNWCFWTVVLEKTLESPLDLKEIQPVYPKGNQSWIFIGRTGVDAETPILRPPDVKNWLTWKTPWCWERLRAGREGDDRGWDGWMESLTRWTWVWVSSGLGDGQGGPAVHGITKSWTWLSDWTELNTVKNFSLVNEAGVYVFLELSCFSYDPTDVGNFISGSSAFSKTSLNIWKFMVHILLKPDLENFEHYLSSIWNECSCVVVWTFFGIALFWDWNEIWPFPVLWPLLSFPNLLAYCMQHFHSIIF